ncbi:hypothetical protein AB6735_13290 [Mucilaginibacter sp. RCC_168]|jgi:hypothetical protein|uniref:hypothetical protein n=1 Tax=Mucilaginibacter sp. RCC_168 TaxID=3239221 RepID=UPI0035236DC8
MNKLFFLFFLIPAIAFGQKKLPGPPTKEDEEIAERNYQCLNHHKYNATQRRTLFPFNTAKSIILISFNDTKADINYLPVKNHVLISGKVRERKILSKTGIDSLTDILFNVGYTSHNGPLEIADPGANCYNPRNAILFMDNNERVAQYIEYCFQCQHNRLSSKNIKDIEYCEQKYDILKTFFLSQGIKIGTLLETR